MIDTKNTVDFICFSHLRWDFVYQRPQHLLSRCSKTHRVFFIEEPIFGAENPYPEIKEREGVTIIVPHLQNGLNSDQVNFELENMVSQIINKFEIKNYVFWYYTPMALGFSNNFQPLATIFDCMDELSAFKFAPQELKDKEAELLSKADLVFCGGESLYQAKKNRHQKVYKFPSSIDFKHFSQARENAIEPIDQKEIPSPKLGFFGVIDERMDIDLLDNLAKARPDWNFVIIGPVVKIDPATLPRYSNVHYLGGKNYQELPAYLSGWDIALLPFAINESTKFISPTKTPEYLAGGKHVVSTPIEDVIHPYKDKGFVRVAGNSEEFIQCCEDYLNCSSEEINNKQKEIDQFLKESSWDSTWENMDYLIANVIKNSPVSTKKANLQTNSI